MDNVVKADLVAFLLPVLSWSHSRSPGDRVSYSSLGPSPGQVAGHLGRLPAHRSRLVQHWVAGQRARLELERLPAYAPELNPVEYLWGYWKQHELPNFCPKNFAELSHHARRALRRMRGRSSLVRSFWQQAQLL